jgi:hypothetical protein
MWIISTFVAPAKPPGPRVNTGFASLVSVSTGSAVAAGVVSSMGNIVVVGVGAGSGVVVVVSISEDFVVVAAVVVVSVVIVAVAASVNKAVVPVKTAVSVKVVSVNREVLVEDAEEALVIVTSVVGISLGSWARLLGAGGIGISVPFCATAASLNAANVFSVLALMEKTMPFPQCVDWAQNHHVGSVVATT